MVPVGNLLLYAVVATAPTIGFWLALRLGRAVRTFVARRRAPRPEGLPIERLAADLRRVHRALTEFAPGTPATRRYAARQAYDALLMQACREVGVRHRLDRVPEGVDREVERLRVEQGLRDAGLVIP
ncbi:hypothetical protein [Amycolatopsis anabasis]|uniref:hypothetical protein n=1 Tax=Amycolatopsis anabasis TaxID=1840409 RepID=UPI00131EC22F|nr:hypothetical protein [Amycolatopsis anabasis]